MKSGMVVLVFGRHLKAPAVRRKVEVDNTQSSLAGEPGYKALNKRLSQEK